MHAIPIQWMAARYPAAMSLIEKWTAELVRNPRNRRVGISLLDLLMTGRAVGAYWGVDKKWYSDAHNYDFAPGASLVLQSIVCRGMQVLGQADAKKAIDTPGFAEAFQEEKPELLRLYGGDPGYPQHLDELEKCMTGTRVP
jgi:hypothetical protein